ncbi:MAG: hypothetical protein DMG24_17160 [Acidobacteria bacterium]|nr:MAG: hypothetical protein DMG24_17160 [Acidobacteriota bacterium]
MISLRGSSSFRGGTDRGFWAGDLAEGPGNEAGMCPGINGFTKYAPVADWVVGEHLYGAPVALQRIGKRRSVKALGTKPECVLESTVSQSTLPSRIGL